MMGLRAFHLFFITVSIVMSVGFGAWAVGEYSARGGAINLFWIGLAGVGAVVLAIYESKVVKKFKLAHIE